MTEDALVDRAVPLEWTRPSAPPLEVDFGCHRGTFLVEMALLHGKHNFLGIEKQPKRVEKCLSKIRRLGLTNALVVQGEGAESLKRLLPDGCVSIFHISFPDPWPKRRHAARRLICENFIREIKRVMRVGGSLRLMTDDENYFCHMRKLTSSGWKEGIWEDRQIVHTAFEQTFLKLEKQPFRAALIYQPEDRLP